MKIVKIRVFRCTRLRGQQLVCASQPALVDQGLCLVSLLAPALLRLQFYICNSLAFDLNPLSTQGRQAHQEESRVKTAAVDSASERFSLDFHATRCQQLCELTDVQPALGNGVLQQLAGHGLPDIPRMLGGQFRFLGNFFQATSLWQYVVCFQHLFYPFDGLSASFRVTNMSPLFGFDALLLLSSRCVGALECRLPQGLDIKSLGSKRWQ